MQTTQMTIKHKSIKYVCPCCFMQYKLKIYYDRHVSACELLHQSNKDRRYLDTKIPNISELYDMVLTLSQKNKELESKINELSKFTTVKKNLDVREWLDEQYVDITPFMEYIKLQTITHDDYELVCKHDYIKGIGLIFKKILSIENEAQLPIKAFEQKKNTFFIKHKDGWRIMQNSELDSAILYIDKQLMKKFVEWQNVNKHRMRNEVYAEEYTDILQKILGNNFNSANIKLTIRRTLYKHLKKNLKNILQVDFII